VTEREMPKVPKVPRVPKMRRRTDNRGRRSEIRAHQRRVNPQRSSSFAKATEDREVGAAEPW
jgi:hypothetical protein